MQGQKDDLCETFSDSGTEPSFFYFRKLSALRSLNHSKHFHAIYDLTFNDRFEQKLQFSKQQKYVNRSVNIEHMKKANGYDC